MIVLAGTIELDLDDLATLRMVGNIRTLPKRSSNDTNSLIDASSDYEALAPAVVWDVDADNITGLVRDASSVDVTMH